MKYWAIPLFFVVALGTSCSGGSPQSRPALTTLRPSSARVSLVAPPTELHRQCVTAADHLGFAVPCLTEVPETAGHAMSCPPQRTTTETPCVGLEGLPPYPIFALEFTGFDVPPGYIGVDGKAMGHIFIEARPQTESPPLPCIGAQSLGPITIGTRFLADYNCPKDSLRVQREAMHGEGAYTGHLLVKWSDGGIEYIASAHGHTPANLNLLKRLVTSVRLVAPRGT